MIDWTGRIEVLSGLQTEELEGLEKRRLCLDDKRVRGRMERTVIVG
jgi:hypothetical protein